MGVTTSSAMPSKMAGRGAVILALACLSLALVDFQKAFESADANQDARLGKKELRSAMESLGVHLNKADAAHSSSTYDMDSDGKLDMAEFEALAAAELATSG